jgi:hypothetical protein
LDEFFDEFVVLGKNNARGQGLPGGGAKIE